MTNQELEGMEEEVEQHEDQIGNIFKERVIAISLLLGVEHGEQDHTASQEYQALKVKHEAEAREECKSKLQLNLQ